MLSLCIETTPELWDEKKEEFIPAGVTKVDLEHSLVSLSKWEQKWEKPFLTSEKSTEETLDYNRCMLVDENTPTDFFDKLTEKHINQINKYINAKMTATWFNEKAAQGKGASQNKEVITAEVIYYWMIALTIPSEYRFWHLETLLTLIKVCNEKNQPVKKKKFTAQDAMDRNALNEKRLKEMEQAAQSS